jgi:RNA polymerase primary sigma factor
MTVEQREITEIETGLSEQERRYQKLFEKPKLTPEEKTELSESFTALYEDSLSQEEYSLPDLPPELDPIKIYFWEIGREKLLERHEEIKLARIKEKGSVAQSLISLDGLDPQTRASLERHVEQGKKASDILIERNLRLAAWIALKSQRKEVDLEDLIQEGNMGLIRATEKFDWRRGKFSTYAFWWIRQGINRAIDYQSSTIRIPAHMRERIRRITKISESLTKELGRQPSLEEISEVLELNKNLVEGAFRFAGRQWTLSLEEQIGEDDEGSSLGEFIPSSLPGPESITLEQTVQDERERLLSQLIEEELTPREREIAVRRFGKEFKTLEEVGREVSLSRERVRQISTSAQLKLRRRMRLDMLRKNGKFPPPIPPDKLPVDCSEEYLKELPFVSWARQTPSAWNQLSFEEQKLLLLRYPGKRGRWNISKMADHYGCSQPKLRQKLADAFDNMLLFLNGS